VKIAGFAWVVATLALAMPAFATTKEACVASYEQTQSLRQAGKLSAAREAALVCAREECPDVVRGDCASWLTAIEESLPTVVLVARDASGSEIADARVLEGERVVQARLDGKAVPMDPGEHQLRFEREGAPPVTLEVIVHEGDKRLRIEASFGVDEAPSEGGGGRSILAPALIGGAGLVGLAVAGTLGGLALAQKSDLEGSCAPNCTDAEVAPVRTKLLAADVTAGVSIAALATAAIVFFTSSGSNEPRKTSALQFEFFPTKGGGFAGVRGAFQ